MTNLATSVFNMVQKKKRGIDVGGLICISRFLFGVSATPLVDLYKSSIDQVPDVIDFLTKKGYAFKTAAECIGDVNPHAPVIPEGRLKAQSNAEEEVKPVDATPPKEQPASLPPSPPVQEEKKESDNVKKNEPKTADLSSPTSAASITQPSAYVAFFVFALLSLLS